MDFKNRLIDYIGRIVITGIKFVKKYNIFRNPFVKTNEITKLNEKIKSLEIDLDQI